MAGPTHNELQFHVDEIGWSLVSMCKHMFRSRVADVQGDDDTSQAAFDGAVLHVRAIVEFLGRTTGGHIHATHYCATWDGFATANALGFDMWDLYRTLNIHAAHLGRERFKKDTGQRLGPHSAATATARGVPRIVELPEHGFREGVGGALQRGPGALRADTSMRL